MGSVVNSPSSSNMGNSYGVNNDEQGARQVNDETDDEGYGSILSDSSPSNKQASKQLKRRRKVRQEDLKIVEGDTKDVLVEKFILLRDAYDEILDEKTRLEYEVESLKDDHEESENEMKLQKSELLQLTEILKVLKEEREGDKKIIERQQLLIDSIASNSDQNELNQ